MPKRFNHMELTFPRGALDDATRADIAAFYGEMFGWRGVDVELFEQKNFLLAGDDGVAVVHPAGRSRQAHAGAGLRPPRHPVRHA